MSNATNYDHVLIKLDENGKGDIWLNGQKLKHTFGFRIAATANYITKIVIEIMGTVEYEGPAEIAIQAIDGEPDIHAAARVVDSFASIGEG